MQLGRAHLTPVERQRRMKVGEYLLRPAGPFSVCLSSPAKRLCSSVAVGVLVSKTNTLINTPPRVQLQATLCVNQMSLLLLALVDSEAEQSFLDRNLIIQAGVSMEPLEIPAKVSTLDGRFLAHVTHQTEPVLLVVPGNHHEYIQFFVFSAHQTPLVIGHPWLKRHNPHIDWSLGKILSLSSFCHSSCLQSALPPTEANVTPLVVPSPDLSNMPSVYHDLGEVFSKERALSLPPHHSHDCAIDLLPGATLPSSQLYSLSKPERQAMETYINDSLAAGLICPSSSPVGAGFFFVAKKDKSLCPCIDFHGLNNITIKNKYPLPLISSAFEPLQGATAFTSWIYAAHITWCA